jgi:hypothetical protein
LKCFTRLDSLMPLTETIGAATIDGLAYIGGLARLIGGAIRAVFVLPFQGKKFHIGRAIHQAMSVGVEALPITSLISFFVGTILAVNAAYELRKLGALHFVASGVAIAITRELGNDGAGARAISGGAEISGDGADGAMPDVLGGFHGSAGRRHVWRFERGVYVGHLHSGDTGCAGGARHHHRADQGGDVRTGDYGSGLPRRFFDGIGFGTSGAFDDFGGGEIYFYGSDGVSGFHDNFLRDVATVDL